MTPALRLTIVLEQKRLIVTGKTRRTLSVLGVDRAGAGPNTNPVHRGRC
jgi:hypothetical protein